MSIHNSRSPLAAASPIAAVFSLLGRQIAVCCPKELARTSSNEPARSGNLGRVVGWSSVGASGRAQDPGARASCRSAGWLT